MRGFDVITSLLPPPGCGGRNEMRFLVQKLGASSLLIPADGDQESVSAQTEHCRNHCRIPENVLGRVELLTGIFRKQIWS